MKAKELESLSGLIQKAFVRRNENTSKLLADSTCELELSLFKYFLENRIDTIFILFTGCFVNGVEGSLSISFRDIESYNNFNDAWCKYIADTTGLATTVKQDPLTKKYTTLTMTIYGNTLVSLGMLLYDEIETKLLNSK